MEAGRVYHKKPTWLCFAQLCPKQSDICRARAQVKFAVTALPRGHELLTLLADKVRPLHFLLDTLRAFKTLNNKETK